MNAQPRSRSFLLIGIISLLLSSLVPFNQAQADVIHLATGQTVRGKVGRVTGDIIGFQRDTGHFSFFTPEESIQRLRLTNRHDVVETRNQETVYGEILYVDRFRVELRTSSGTASIPRINIKNIVLGS